MMIKSHILKTIMINYNDRTDTYLIYLLIEPINKNIILFRNE